MITNSKEAKKSTESDDWNEDSDAPIDHELTRRETHTLIWVKREGKKTLEEYFDCERYQLRDEEGDELYLTNKDMEKYLPSPTGKEPAALNSEKFIDETYEHAIPKLIISEETRGKYFTLMAGFNISHAIAFPFVMMRFGGYFFFIPFIICTIFITFPINFAQYALGQFTNMPPIVLYSRMSPIYVGVGSLTVLVQYISASTIRFDHRFMSMAFELFYTLTAEINPYEGGSTVNGMMNGYRPICLSGEILRYNECLPRDAGNYRFGKTDREYFQDKIRSELQSDRFIADYSIADMPPNRIFDPIYQHSHYISAATVLSICLFFVSLLLVKTYFKRIQHIVFYGSIVTCTATLVNIVASWDRQATILVTVIGLDFSKIFEFKTWIIAAIHSMILFATIDGSYLAIGSANKFSNKIFSDLFRAKIGGFLVLLLFSTVFGMATIVGASIWMMRTEKRALTVHNYRILIYSDAQVYEFLYVFFFQNMAYKLLMLIFMLLFCFWEVSSLMLMAEGTVATVYRIFKSTARLPQFVIRYLSLIFHCSFVLFMHFFMKDNHRLPFLLVPYVVLPQLLTFSILNYKRFFTIIVTLHQNHRSLLYTNRKKIRFYYRYVLNGLILTIITYDVYCNGFKFLKRTLLPVLIVVFCQMFRYRFVSKTWKSWSPTARFKPTYYQDLEQYRKQEKAMNGKMEIRTDEDSEQDSKKPKRETPKKSYK